MLTLPEGRASINTLQTRSLMVQLHLRAARCREIRQFGQRDVHTQGRRLAAIGAQARDEFIFQRAGIDEFQVQQFRVQVRHHAARRGLRSAQSLAASRAGCPAGSSGFPAEPAGMVLPDGRFWLPPDPAARRRPPAEPVG